MASEQVPRLRENTASKLEIQVEMEEIQLESPAEKEREIGPSRRERGSARRDLAGGLAAGAAGAGGWGERDRGTGGGHGPRRSRRDGGGGEQRRQAVGVFGGESEDHRRGRSKGRLRGWREKGSWHERRVTGGKVEKIEIGGAAMKGVSKG